MARTIKQKTQSPTPQVGELVEKGESNDNGFFNNLSGNDKAQIINGATQVVHDVLEVYNTKQKCRQLESQYSRDIQLSADEVKKARLDLDKFTKNCDFKLNELEKQSAQMRDQHAKKLEVSRDLRNKASECWDRYVETGDTASLETMKLLIQEANKD